MAVSVSQFAQTANWFSATSPSTVTGLSWNAGDEIIVVGGTGNGGSTLSTPTNANLTFTLRASVTTGGINESFAYVWTAVAANSQTGQTVSAVITGTQVAGIAAWVVAGGSGVFANASANQTESAFTFTPTAGSLVIYGAFDWAATSGKTQTAGTGTATERVDTTDSTNYGIWLGDWLGVTASSTSFGITSYAGMTVAHIVIEVLAAGGSDRDPLRLPPPIIGNPYIGDIGRGSNLGIAPRRPAIPFVLWYGENEPVTAVASTDTPPRPTVVTADGPITAPMVGYNIIKTMVSPPVVEWPPPVIVGQQQSPNHLQRPFVFVEQQPPATVAAAPGVPAKASLTPQQQLPFQQPFVYVERPPSEPPAAPVGTPEQPVMARAVELPWSPPQVFIAKTATADQLDVTPPVPIVAVGAGVIGGASAFVNRAAVPAVVLPTTPPPPTVVSALQPPQALPFVEVLQPRDFAAAPVVGDTPRPPTMVRAVELPQPVQVPQIVRQRIEAAVPAKPTIVAAQPLPQPVQSPQVSQSRVDPAIEPPVPIRPTVVNAQPLPGEPGQSRFSHGFAEALAPDQTPVPIRPTIVNAQPLPTPYVQAPWVSYTDVDSPKVPVYPTVIGQQPIPPQSAFVSTPKAGRWGSPPPTHRVITPQVTTDLSLPFRPNGWVRVAHGFAEAMPLLFEGTVTGGIRDGAYVGGGGLAGAGVTGQVQAGYVTGGVR